MKRPPRTARAGVSPRLAGPAVAPPAAGLLLGGRCVLFLLLSASLWCRFLWEAQGALFLLGLLARLGGLWDTCLSVLPSRLPAPFCVRFLLRNVHALARNAFTHVRVCLPRSRIRGRAGGILGAHSRPARLPSEAPGVCAQRRPRPCWQLLSSTRPRGPGPRAPPPPWTQVFLSICQLLSQRPDGDSREFRSEKWCKDFCVLTSQDSADRWTGRLGAAGASRCTPFPR